MFFNESFLVFTRYFYICQYPYYFVKCYHNSVSLAVHVFACTVVFHLKFDVLHQVEAHPVGPQKKMVKRCLRRAVTDILDNGVHSS